MTTSNEHDWKLSLAVDVKEIYNGNPCEQAYHHFTEDAVFQDPPTKCIGLGEIKSSFNSLPKLFDYGLVNYTIFPDFAEDTIKIEMVTRYTPKLIHKDIILDSHLFLKLRGDKVCYMEEKWHGQDNTKEDSWAGKILQAIRRGNAALVHALVSEEPPKKEDKKEAEQKEHKPGYKLPAVLGFEAMGLTIYNRFGFWKHSREWDPKELDVSCYGKTYMITGANSGLGYEASKAVAEHKGTVIMICRNREKGEKARDQIIKETGNDNVELQIVDVARPQQIRAFTTEFVNSGRKLDYLVNNAGCLVHERMETEEGYELTFASHSIHAYLMTEWLLPALERTPGACVLTTVSGGAYPVRVDADDLEFKKPSSYDGYKSYAYQKRAQIYLTEHWAQKYGDKGITFNAWHPGWAATPGVAMAMPKFFLLLAPRSQSQGADTLCWLCITDAAKNVSGKIFFDRKLETPDFKYADTQSTEEEKQRIFDYMQAIKNKYQ